MKSMIWEVINQRKDIPQNYFDFVFQLSLKKLSRNLMKNMLN